MLPFITSPKLVRFCFLLLPLLLWLSGFQRALAQSQLTNLSTRARLRPPSALSPSDSVVAGFIITGTGSSPKALVVRGLGPTLLFSSLSPVLSDPLLTLNGCASCPEVSDSWYVPFANGVGYLFATGNGGPPPPTNLESGLYRSLPSGSYTATVEHSPANATLGFALVDLYDIDLPNGKVVNLSTRAFVGTAAEIVIAGFILGGPGPERIVIRGLGPSLAAFGLSNLLADPTLDLRDSGGLPVMFNDNWQDDPAQAAELTARGLAPTNSLEAGIVISLAPGLYTVFLAGLGNTTGNGIVEIYDVGP